MARGEKTALAATASRLSSSSTLTRTPANEVGTASRTLAARGADAILTRQTTYLRGGRTRFAKWVQAHFFFAPTRLATVKRTTEQERVANQVETVLAERFPEVELIDVALHGGRQPAVTLFIDRPAGGDLELRRCSAATHGQRFLLQAMAADRCFAVRPGHALCAVPGSPGR